MCNCGCTQKDTPQAVPPSPEENQRYACFQCNASKEAASQEPVPECCGKKMQEMD